MKKLDANLFLVIHSVYFVMNDGKNLTWVVSVTLLIKYVDNNLIYVYHYD